MAEIRTAETEGLPLPALANVLPEDKLIALDKFDDAARKRIAEIAATVSMADSNSVIGFGAEPQRRMNAFLDDMLKGVRTDEVGAAGELILELATNIKAINLPKMKEEVSGHEGLADILGKLPISRYRPPICWRGGRAANGWTKRSASTRR